MWDTKKPNLDLASTTCIEEDLTDTGVVSSTKTTDYDARGNRLSDHRALWNGQVQTDLRYENRYDADGRIVEMIVTKGDGTPQYRETWTYRDDGRKLEWFRYNQDGDLADSNLFTFDGDKLISTIATDEISGRTMFQDRTYDDRGRLVRSETKDEYSSSRVDYELDEQGRVVKRWTYVRGACSFGERLSYEGDRVVCIENLSPEGEVTKARTFRYDDRGRVVEERAVGPDGRSVVEAKRFRYESTGRA